MAKTFQDSVSYVGDVRIIGVIVNKQGGNIIGYVLYLEQKGTVEFISLNLLANFASVLKPSNFILNSDGSVTCTECALNRLPEYIVINNQLTPINIRNIYVLGEVRTNGRLTSYRVISGTGKVVDLTLEEVINYTNQGIELVNVHFSSSSKGLVPNKEDKFIKIERKQVASEKKTPATSTKDGYNFYGNPIKDKNKATYLKKLVPGKLHPYKLSSIAPRGSFLLGCTDKSLVNRADFDFLYKFLKKVYKTEVYAFCENDEERKYFKKFFDIAFDKENWTLKNRNFNDGKHKLREVGEINEKAGWCFCLMSQFMLKAYSVTITVYSTQLKALNDLNIPIYFVDNVEFSGVHYRDNYTVSEISLDNYSLELNSSLALIGKNKVKVEYGRRIKSLLRPDIAIDKPSYLTGFSFDAKKTSIRDTVVIDDTVISSARYESHPNVCWYPCTKIYNFYQMFDKEVITQIDDLSESLGDIMCAYQLLKIPNDVGYVTRARFAQDEDISDGLETLDKVRMIFATLLLTFNKPLFDFINTQVDLSKYSYKPLDLSRNGFYATYKLRDEYCGYRWYKLSNIEGGVSTSQLRSWYESGLRYFETEGKFHSIKFIDIHKILILVWNLEYMGDYGVHKSIYSRCSIFSPYCTDKKLKAGTIIKQIKG